MCYTAFYYTKEEVFLLLKKLTAKKTKRDRVTRLENVQWKWVAAVIPYYYGANRTACQVHYSDGKYEIVYTGSKRALEEWMKYHGTTLPVVQERSCQLAGGGRRFNLIVNEELCVMPLKSRERQGQSGSTLGYFNKDAIAFVIEVDDYGTMIFFHETHKGILIPQKKGTVELQMARGNQMQTAYILQQKEKQQREDELLKQSRNRKKQLQTEDEEMW